MANSFVRYTGNGSTTQYAISFTYRDQADITVTINGVATTAFTYNSAGTQITFSSPPANLSAIEIRRKTSQTSRLVDYAAGSVLTENDLDTDSNQAFFMSQEAIDDAGDVIKLDAANFQWDVQNKRLTNVADPVDNTDAVNKQFISTNIPNITTVAGISTDVTDVANIASDVTTVANDATDIGTVASNIADVSTVATNIADVVTVANDLNEAISEIETAANDLNEATSEIDTVSNNIANVNTVGTNIANVNTVAGIDANVTTVAGISSDVTSVAGISTAVSNVNSNSTNINAVNANSANINTVAGINADVTSVAGVSSDVSTVASNNANVSTVAGISSDVTTVAGVSSAVSSVASNSANVSAVGTDIANVNSVAGSIASINTAATNLTSINSFANTYLGASATPPTQDPDGSALDLGDLYFDTASSTMKVYGSAGWTNAGSSVNGTADRFKYTATSGQTTFTGLDDNSATLQYDAGFLDVYLNGVRLINGDDFTATDGTSIVLATGAATNDILSIIAFGTFELANFSITDATDVPPLGTAGQALVVNSAGTSLEFANASSAEVYGFNKDSNGNLIVTTTNQGQDNISSTDYANFDDVLFSASGFTFSISNGELIATI